MPRVDHHREGGDRLFYFTFEPADCTCADSLRRRKAAILHAPPQRRRRPAGAFQDDRLPQEAASHSRTRTRQGAARGDTVMRVRCERRSTGMVATGNESVEVASWRLVLRRVVS